MWRVIIKMKNQIVYILPGIFLLINAWYDIRKRKILLHSIWIFTVLWILFLMFVDKEKIWQAFGGILPGMFLLASAYATRQAIGYGDGLAVCVCGLRSPSVLTLFIIERTVSNKFSVFSAGRFKSSVHCSFEGYLINFIVYILLDAYIFIQSSFQLAVLKCLLLPVLSVFQ